MSLSLPPEGIFDNFKGLDTFYIEYTILVDYTVIIDKSELRKGHALKYINYKRNGIEKCSLGEARQRRRQSIKAQCKA